MTTLLSLPLVVLLLGPPESLQKARPDLPPKLRPAEAILDDYVAAVGGAPALKKLKSLHMKRKLEVKGMQFSGTEDRYATAAGQMLVLMEITGVMSAKQGTNGKVHWSEDQIFGLRILKGAEAEEAKIDAAWNADLRIKELYEKVRSVAPPEPAPAGKRWECIELTPRVGKPTISCFDAETHLRAMQKGNRATPQGETPYKATFGDWREVKGFKLPHSEELTMGPVTLLATVTEVKFDEKFPAKLFELPKAARTAKKPAGEEPAAIREANKPASPPAATAPK
jgi:hypothetical protein